MKYQGMCDRCPECDELEFVFTYGEGFRCHHCGYNPNKEPLNLGYGEGKS